MKAKFCTDINYGGVCKTYTLRDDGCFNMSYEFDHQVSSLDPSIGVLATCDVYAFVLFVIAISGVSLSAATQILFFIFVGDPGVAEVSSTRFRIPGLQI